MEYIKAKSIVTRTKSTAWFGAQYNMNTVSYTHLYVYKRQQFTGKVKISIFSI